jgi:hypothetical protein
LDEDGAQLKENNEEEAVESMYMFEGRDYSQDREAFKKITEAGQQQTPIKSRKHDKL